MESEKGMATHSNILAWRLPWTEEPGGLQSMGSAHGVSRVGCNRVIEQQKLTPKKRTHRDLPGGPAAQALPLVCEGPTHRRATTPVCPCY